MNTEKRGEKERKRNGYKTARDMFTFHLEFPQWVKKEYNFSLDFLFWPFLWHSRLSALLLFKWNRIPIQIYPLQTLQRNVRCALNKFCRFATFAHPFFCSFVCFVSLNFKSFHVSCVVRSSMWLFCYFSFFFRRSLSDIFNLERKINRNFYLKCLEFIYGCCIIGLVWLLFELFSVGFFFSFDSFFALFYFICHRIKSDELRWCENIFLLKCIMYRNGAVSLFSYKFWDKL